MQQNNNPPLSPLVRWSMVIVALVLASGSSLFLAPALISHRWPWALAPFNTRFLGAIYLAELAAVCMLIIVNRWNPGRLVLPLAFIFTVLVSLVSGLHFDQFDPQRLVTWVWFILYIGSVLMTGYFLWCYRGLPPVNPTPPSPAWRRYLQVQAGIVGLYSLGLLLMPTIFSAVWPWPIDSFHAQVYSAIFVTAAVGAYLLSRAAAPLELFTLGLAQSLFGWSVILGLIIVDASVHRIDWSQWSTWLWLGAFAGLGVAGLAMVWQAYTTRQLSYR